MLLLLTRNLLQNCVFSLNKKNNVVLVVTVSRAPYKRYWFNFFFGEKIGFFFTQFRYDIIIRLYMSPFLRSFTFIFYRHIQYSNFDWNWTGCDEVHIPFTNQFHFYLDWPGTRWTAKWLFIRNMDTCTALKIYVHSSAGSTNGANCVHKRIGKLNLKKKWKMWLKV